MAIASRICTHRLDLVPAVMPDRFPAWLRSWQGDPPVMMSTGSTVAQSTVVMSPRFGMPGKRMAMILHAPGSMSDTQAVVAPSTASTAPSRPPYPVNRLPILMPQPLDMYVQPYIQ